MFTCSQFIIQADENPSGADRETADTGFRIRGRVQKKIVNHDLRQKAWPDCRGEFRRQLKYVQGSIDKSVLFMLFFVKIKSAGLSQTKRRGRKATAYLKGNGGGYVSGHASG